MIFMVQSGKYDAVTLEQRIQEFLPGFLNTLAEMPEEELETLKVGDQLQTTEKYFSFCRGRTALQHCLRA